MATAPNVQLVGDFVTILGIAGTPPAVGQFVGLVTIQLCGYGSQIPRIPGQSMLVRVTDVPEVTPQGYFTAWLFDNTLIEPPGTYYTVTQKNENGDITQVNALRFTTGGYYDLSLQPPYDPNQPPPALLPLVLNELLVVPYSDAPDFPGDTYTSWQITLNGDATATFSDLVDGNLYTIIIVQDGSGGHNFAWPLNVYNPTGPDREPNAISVQTFVAVTNMLYPIGAGTYYP